MTVNVGDRVLVRTKDKYGGRLAGRVGTVRSKYLSSIGVAIDDLPNTNSEYGWYYFTSGQLKKLDEVKTEVEVYKMEGKYTVALVRFLDGQNTDKTFEYACYDGTLEAGDKVVVKSAHHGFGVGEIAGFADNKGQDVIREIVCRADFSAYEARCRSRKRRNELRKEMAKKAAQMQELAMYKALAQEDPAMADLVKEYMELCNGS